MKILFMADVEPDPNSGAAGTEVQTLKELENLGVDIDTVWSKYLSHFISHGNLHYLLELPISLRSQLKKSLRHRRYDVIHVNQPHGFLAAKEIKKNHDEVIFVHRSHGFELRVKRDLAKWHDKFGWERRSVFRRSASMIMEHLLERNSRGIAKYADGHIVSATECKDYLVHELGVSTDNVAVIPQAPPRLFTHGQIKPIGFERLKKLLYVGQFAFIKAPMILADVFNNLAKRRDDIELTWVCSNEHHNKARGMLEPSIRGRVKFLDWLPQNSLQEVYDSHGIFLFPSFFEGFGKVFLEAMSRGLCVIAADNGGMKDNIDHHINGIKVPTGDAKAVTVACLGLLNNPGIAAEISRNAIRSSKEYSWERVAKDTLSFYEALLSRKQISGNCEW